MMARVLREMKDTYLDSSKTLMLPYGTGICCYAFIYKKYKKIIASVHSFSILFLKSGIYKLTEWSTIPV